jgi:uncharacterized repeat protein (TIGR04076 family)
MIEEKKEWDESDNIVAKILKGENRYYQEVTIAGITGDCPYGHREGEKYKVTALNSDGLCGSLYKTIHAAMMLQASGRTNALRALLKAEQHRGPDFLRLANALSALYPKTSEEKRLLDAMLLAVPR